MIPLYCQMGNLSLIILPDTLAHLNGHAVITHTYSIFRDRGDNGPEKERNRESMLHLGEIKDPDYYGFITFELPDKLFVYTADGSQELSTEQVERLIEFLSDFRSNPGLWENRDL